MARKYRIKHFENRECVAYRTFYYTPRQAGLRGFLATLSAALGVSLLLPLPDELFVMPALAKSLEQGIGINFNSALLYAYGIYKGLGLAFLLLALFFGTKYLREAFARKTKHIKAVNERIRGYRGL